jgi:hypothetical protein
MKNFFTNLKIFSRIFQKYLQKKVTKVVKKGANVAHVIAFGPF